MPPTHDDNHKLSAHEKLLQSRLQQLPVFARELLAGGAAGGLAKTCVAPLERTKIIFQTRGGQMTVSGVLTHIWQHEGVPGLFRGNTASVLRIVPYAAIHFGSYEYIRRYVVRLAGAEGGGHGPTAPSSLPVYDLLAGSASGAIAVIATYPLDLVRTRLAWATEAPAAATTAATAATGPQHPTAATGAATGAPGAATSVVQHHQGVWSTLRGTVAEEGMAGLYRGCAPTLLGILPYAGLKFYVYQLMKNSYRTWQMQQEQRLSVVQQQQQQLQQDPKQQQQDGQNNHPHLPPAPPFETALQQVQVADDEEEEQQQKPQKLPVAITLLFGGVAGLVAQTVTYPLDVIRRQMQVSHLQLAPQPSSSSSSTGQASSGGRAGFSSGSARAYAHSSCNAQHMSSRMSGHSSSSRRAAWVGQSVPQHLRALTSSQGHTAAAAAATAAADPSMMEVAVKLWRQGGMFRGLSINYLKVVPSTAIGFTVYDWMKAYLGLAHS